jgi:nucleotide-binding universal stress UspA family protein
LIQKRDENNDNTLRPEDRIGRKRDGKLRRLGKIQVNTKIDPKKGECMIPQIKKILYATNLSKNSSYAFLYALDMARRFDARIIILHAIEPIRPYLYAEGGAIVYNLLEREKEKEKELDTEEMKSHLQGFCKKAEAQIGSPCVELISKILVPLGHPVVEILRVADEENCDAIVMGTHGKGFLKHTFLGSVAGSVLERTRKPIFVIPLPSDEIDTDWDGI